MSPCANGQSGTYGQSACAAELGSNRVAHGVARAYGVTMDAPPIDGLSHFQLYDPRCQRGLVQAHPSA